MSSTASDLVVLRGGLAVPLDALQLLWALEDKGCIIRMDGDDLLIGPRTKLDANDRARIAEHRDHIRALVRLCEAIQ